MRNLLADRPKTRGLLIVLGALVLLAVLFALFFDWNLFRPTLARMISAKTGRHTEIRGNLRVHLWSFEPSAEVDGLTLDNPPWAKHSVMFTAEQLDVSVSLGRLLRGQVVVPQIKVVRPAIDLERDAKGRASWEFASEEGRPQKSSQPAKIPTIRRLIIESGTIRVADGIRKLKLDGTLNASDGSGREDGGFQLKCTGSLNDKPFRAELQGGPLIDLDPNHPYDLTAHLTAADIKLEARTSFPKPFDLAQYTVKFEVSGNDLADVFYLTGLALPNTPPYRLSADVEHRGTLFRMDDLKGKLGSSDLEGSVDIETGRTRPKFSAKLHSDTLNIVDLAPTLGQPPAAANTLSAPTPPAAAKRAHHGAETPPPQPSLSASTTRGSAVALSRCGSAGESRARHGRRRQLSGTLGRGAEIAHEGSAVSFASDRRRAEDRPPRIRSRFRQIHGQRQHRRLQGRARVDHQHGHRRCRPQPIHQREAETAAVAGLHGRGASKFMGSVPRCISSPRPLTARSASHSPRAR